MTKFEEELFNKVPCKFELTTEATYKKTTLINHFKNWHSDEEYQELLEQNAELTRENNIVNQINSKLESQIIGLKSQLQQQALPVVPEWLDIEIKHFKSTSKHPTVDVIFGVADAIVAVKNGNTHSKLYDYLFCGKQDVCNQHQAIFALAFITGKYQVEKPQLFRVCLLDGRHTLTRRDPRKTLPFNYTFLWSYSSELKEMREINRKVDLFTEQEIKSIDERYWQFAVPMEDSK